MVFYRRLTGCPPAASQEEEAVHREEEGGDVPPGAQEPAGPASRGWHRPAESAAARTESNRPASALGLSQAKRAAGGKSAAPSDSSEP